MDRYSVKRARASLLESITEKYGEEEGKDQRDREKGKTNCLKTIRTYSS